MRLFKLKGFARFARKSGIADAMLVKAVSTIAAGSIDADLGGGVFKQRVARQGAGKSGGFRTILFMKHGHRVLFVRGFAKKDMDNISVRELSDLREFAVTALGLDEMRVETLLEDGDWIEVSDATEI